MTFDALDRMILEMAPTTILSQAVKSEYRYDGNGNLLSVVETLGDGSIKSELNQYDGRDRLTLR
jgi:YD repeat-containing protein